MSNKVIVSVINDLVSDQRVDRTCSTLHEMGFEVLLVGRKLKKSPVLQKRAYATKRMRLFFERGAFFYAEFNLRLFLFLLFKKYHVLHSNDLDTLLANRWAQKIRGGALVYDSHELFTEVPEIQNKPKVKDLWLKIERSIFPKLKYVFTVNQSIAEIFEKQYGVAVKVMRNVPKRPNLESVEAKGLGLAAGTKVLILQGAGINVDRGAEELVEAMQWVDGFLLVVGSGDVLPKLQEMTQDLNLSEKIRFTGRVPFQDLLAYTKSAHFGVSLDKPTNLNYQLSLPNKLFDYIHAGLPVIASDLKEVGRVVRSYSVGCVLSSFEPKKMAEEINNYIHNETLLLQTKPKLLQAQQDLCWEKEQEVLINVYKSFR